MMATRLMMQRSPILEGHTNHCPLGRLCCLANCLWNFARFAMTEANATTLVADHDKSSKTETAATLDDFGNPIDVHELVDEFAVAIFASAAVSSSWFTRHFQSFP